MAHYSTSSHIHSVEDVKAFFHHLVHGRKLYTFHPDDMFESNVSCEGGNDGLTLTECSIYNRLVDESFAVCKREDVDIYGIAVEMLHSELDKLRIV